MNRFFSRIPQPTPQELKNVRHDEIERTKHLIEESVTIRHELEKLVKESEELSERQSALTERLCRASALIGQQRRARGNMIMPRENTDG